MSNAFKYFLTSLGKNPKLTIALLTISSLITLLGLGYIDQGVFKEILLITIKLFLI